MNIGDRNIGRDERLYIIAEAGVAHDGSLDRALSLIQQAALAGADAVKFQCYKAEKLAHPDSPTYFQQNGHPAESQFAFFGRYDGFGPEEYRRLAEECQQWDVHFLCTPFDVDCVEWLNDLVPAWKIASADITNGPLLDRVSQSRKPVILSTGAACGHEISAAYESRWFSKNVALLHCVLAYPTPSEHASLAAIPWMTQAFSAAVVGYSDHTLATPEMEVCTYAYVAGARIIEKHFTDDKTRPGNDHYHSMDAQDLRTLRRKTDEARVLLGSGEKRVLPCEADARRYARRGLYAATDLPAGHVLSVRDLAILRPATTIGPDRLEVLVGQALEAGVAKGFPLGNGLPRG